ncbi:MAG TPA: hypothetical protein VML55_02050 [Planctomycetaceae bacterium]|nr:hypothetical protein [Planctomycetaceae bacterium]
MTVIQLTVWAGVEPSSLRRSGRVRILGREAAQLSANVWLHGNVAGQRELADRPAFLLELTQGIAVLPESPGDNYPRLPLLGLRALRWAKLRLHVDCGPCRVTLRTRPWLGVFG